MKSEKKKADQFEEDLQKEEKVLEGIRDSLKGIVVFFFFFFFLVDRALIRSSDKTQVFHDQIEQKQKELQPWKTKVNQKQAEIDIKASERDMLVKKAEGIRQASSEAQEALEKLRSDQKSKVCVPNNVKIPSPDQASRSGSSKISNTGNSRFNRTRKLPNKEYRYGPVSSFPE
jgi:structural maintenance of chromosome 4